MTYGDGDVFHAAHIQDMLGAFSPSGVLKGSGTVEPGSSGLQIDYGAGTVVVGGQSYEYAGSTITLDTADNNYPRKDLIIYEVGTGVKKHTGQPKTAYPTAETLFDTESPEPATLPANSVTLAECWVAQTDAGTLDATEVANRQIIVNPAYFIGNNPPPKPYEGQLWYCTNTAGTFISTLIYKYVSSQWKNAIYTPDTTYTIMDDFSDAQFTSSRANYVTTAPDYGGLGLTVSSLYTVYGKGGELRTVQELPATRPTWTTVSGSPSVASNYLSSASTYEVSVPSTQTTGTWKTDFQYTVSGASNPYSFFKFMWIDANNYYTVQASGNGTAFYLVKVVGGATTNIITSSQAISGAAWHEIKVTRDINGNFEIFFDAASKGTVTDTAHTTSNKIQLYANPQASGGNMYFDNIVVY